MTDAGSGVGLGGKQAGVWCRVNSRDASLGDFVKDRQDQQQLSDKNMAKLRKTWVYSPPKPPAPKVPASAKAEAQQKADQLVETILKPQHLKPPPKDGDFNYIEDIYTK